MMKKLMVLAALVLVAGCGRQSAFEDLKAYISNTPQSHVDPAHLADIMSKICREDDFVSFLKEKIRSGETHDAVAAYVVLAELVAQARLHPTPEWQQIAERIRPADIASEFGKVDTSKLNGTWSEWLAPGERIMSEKLEQAEPTLPGKAALRKSSIDR